MTVQAEQVPRVRCVPAPEPRGMSRALHNILEIDLERTAVDRPPPLPPEIVPDVFVRGDGVVGSDSQLAGQLRDEPLPLRITVPVVDRLVGNERDVFPDL